MNKFNAITLVALICRGGGLKTAFMSAVVAIAIAAALLGGVRHSQAYADSPTGTRASQSPADASQALRRYTLQLLHILSDADSNRWERYRQAMPHCAAAPAYLDEINTGSDAGPLTLALMALLDELCADLDQRLEDSRTVGLLMNEPEAMSGYVLLTGLLNKDVHLIDHLGRIAHSWQGEHQIHHAKLLDNGNILVMVNSRVSSLVELDQDGNIVWRFFHERLHHDFLNMPNGNILMLALGVKTREEAIAAGANPDAVPSKGMRYDYLIEVRPTGTESGEIVWEWSSWDHIAQDFDASKDNYGVIAEHPELIDLNFTHAPPRLNHNPNAWNWLHANGIDYNHELDQIMLSFRNHSELWIMDYSADAEDALTRQAGKRGAPLYRWGNPRAYGHGTADDQRLFQQHHTHWIDPGLPGAGNILVFNNGWLRFDEGQGNYSSVEEIILPLDGYAYRREPGGAYLPAEPAWTYTAETPTDFYSHVMGCVQRLPNGNTLICDSTSGVVFQVTPDGKQVWKYVYPMDADTPLNQGEEASLWGTSRVQDVLNNVVYRAYWYAPDHPGLQHYDLTPGDTIELYE